MQRPVDRPGRPGVGLCVGLGLAAIIWSGTGCDRCAGPGALLAVPVTGSRAREHAAFNAEVVRAAAAGLDWPADPVAVARRFAGRPERRAAWSIEGEGEFPTELHVVAVNDGFSDDSVRGERVEIWLEHKDGSWQINRANFSWRCWGGRGHDTFGIEPCS